MARHFGQRKQQDVIVRFFRDGREVRPVVSKVVDRHRGGRQLRIPHAAVGVVRTDDEVDAGR